MLVVVVLNAFLLMTDHIAVLVWPRQRGSVRCVRSAWPGEGRCNSSTRGPPVARRVGNTKHLFPLRNSAASQVNPSNFIRKYPWPNAARSKGFPGTQKNH